ncbi:Retrovirus-related pol polyprotein from transposon tnt 1-94 [Abeliophyllum distichum]|uniref:Retrovirus-related pol polyprotein from transposon tnt 1-94 n=1 Tax=Abeliophyllum distichum TaxID=126358 RepID=A0ABD1V5Y1_9LAMI
MKSPYQVLYKSKVDYKTLKTFGCACYPCLRPYQQHKFNFHSTKCVLLGFSESHKGYKCLSSTGKIYISRHVVFNEFEFPFESEFIVKKQPNSAESETIVSWFQFPSQLNNSDPSPTDTAHLDATQAAESFPSSSNDIQQPHNKSYGDEGRNQTLSDINEPLIETGDGSSQNTER